MSSKRQFQFQCHSSLSSKLTRSESNPSGHKTMMIAILRPKLFQEKFFSSALCVLPKSLKSRSSNSKSHPGTIRLDKERAKRLPASPFPTFYRAELLLSTLQTHPHCGTVNSRPGQLGAAVWGVIYGPQATSRFLSRRSQ